MKLKDDLSAADLRFARGPAARINMPAGLDVEEPFSLKNNTQDFPEFVASVRAKRELEAAGVNHDEFTPSAISTLGSAFRQENVVGSLVSSQSTLESLFPTVASPRLSADDVIRRAKNDGYDNNLHLFRSVETEAEYAALKADLEKERLDKATLAAAGFTGVAAQLAAGVIDITSLLPGSIGAKLGAKGVSTVRAAAGVSAGAALDSSVSELALHATQTNRSTTESAAAVGGSIILGAMLGVGLHRAARSKLGNDTIDRAERRMEETATDLASGGERYSSVGAAQVDAWQKQRDLGLASYKIAPTTMGAVLKSFGDIPGAIGLNAGIPFLDVQNSKVVATHDAAARLLISPLVNQANVQGIVTGSKQTVQHIAADVQELYLPVHARTEKLWQANKADFGGNFDEFDRQIAIALVDPQRPAHPAVREIADQHRQVYTQVLDRLIEANVLPPETKTKYGANYLSVVYDADMIRAKESEFRDLFVLHFSRQLTEEANLALVEKASRVQKNVEAKERIVGTTERTPRVDDTGSPILNSRTGKPLFERKVLKEGELLERERIFKEQYAKEVARVREDRELGLGIFDTATNSALATVNKVYDDYLNALSKESRVVLDRLAREGLTPAQLSRRLKEAEAEQLRLIRSTEAERRSQVGAVKAARREEKKKLAKKYDDLLDEAKRARDDNLALARTVAREKLKEEIVPVRDGLETALRLTRDNKVSDDLVREEAQRLTERWYNSTTNWRKNTLEHEIDGFAQVLRKRRTPVPHAELLARGFVRSDATGALEDYLRITGVNLGVATNFQRSRKARGPDGKVDPEADLVSVADLKLVGVKESIEDAYRELRDAILSSPEYAKQAAAIEKKYEKLAAKETDPAKKAELAAKELEEKDALKAKVEDDLRLQRGRDVQNIEAIVDALSGRDASGSSRSMRKAAEIVGTAQYVTKMGGIVISSITDPLKIAISVGLGNTIGATMSAWAKGFRPLWLNASLVEKEMSKVGAGVMELHLQARLGSMFDIASPMRSGSPMENFARRAGNLFSKASGITYWNAFWKQVSEDATSAHLGQLAYKSKLRPDEVAYLASLRIDADDLKRIRAAHEAQPGDRWFDDLAILDHHTWEDQQAAMLVRHALREENRNHVVTPAPTDRMSWTTSPVGRLVWQFRQHMISNQLRFIARQEQLARLDSDKATAIALGFVGLVTAGALVDFTKQVTSQVSPIGNVDKTRSPLDRQLEEWTKTPGMALYNALDRSDTMGVLMEMSSVSDKVFGIGPKSIFQTFDDPKKIKEASRFKNRSVADTVLGPTAGTLNDFSTIAKGLGKMARGEKPSRGDYRALERIVPGESIPYIRFFGNALERMGGDQYSWPTPK